MKYSIKIKNKNIDNIYKILIDYECEKINEYLFKGPSSGLNTNPFSFCSTIELIQEDRNWVLRIEYKYLASTVILLLLLISTIFLSNDVGVYFTLLFLIVLGLMILIGIPKFYTSNIKKLFTTFQK